MSHFAKELQETWTAAATDIFINHGFEAGRRSDDREQKVNIRLLQSILKAGGDPDWMCLDHFGRGAKLGVDCKLPRTLAVYARKVRWSLKDQAVVDEKDRSSIAGVWRTNYRTAAVHQELVAAQLDDHHQRGLCLRLSQKEAETLFPNLTVVSLGAVE